MAYAIHRETHYTGKVVPNPEPGLLRDGDLKVVAVETLPEALQLLEAVIADREEVQPELGEYAPPSYEIKQLLAPARPLQEAINALT
jgi:hypothetical protein